MSENGFPNEIKIFATIVERGTFIAASQALKVPKTTVSRKIEELEARLGVRLLQRTTRKLALTEAGRIFHSHCERILAGFGWWRGECASQPKRHSVILRHPPLRART